MSSSYASRASWRLLLVLLALPWLSACKDNISCVFTTGCVGGGGGGTLGASAIAPENGIWIQDARPTVSDVFPDGSDLPGTTPVVVVFSESMNPDSLAGAIQVAPLFGGTAGTPVGGLAQVLVGDGRVLVLLPPIPLDPADYVVQLSPTATPTDITGQELESVGSVGNFTVVGTPPDAPRVIAMWPPGGSTNASDTTEIVAVFDRPVVEATVDDASFVVIVGSGPPADDPPPEPVEILGTGTDTRAFVYRSQDASGRFTRLGSNANVSVTLSPPGSPILDVVGSDPLPETPFSFTTTPFATPLSASLLSQPVDAIGVRNLTPGNAEELLIQVDLADAEPNDMLDLFLFGTARTGMPPPLVAFRRSIQLQGMAPILTAMYTLADVDLTSGGPTDPRFADGPVSFAFRLRRGSVVTPLSVLDVEPVTVTIEDPLLDTTPPVVSALVLPGGTADTFFTDQRDLVLAGRAGEPLRSVEVSTALGDNGIVPPVAGSNAAGLFVAAPVPLGILAGGTIDYTLVAYDSAFNASPPLSGTAFQRGVVGPGGFTPGDPVTIEVVDAGTLEPIQGADVFLHADMGDGVSFPLAQAGTTLADGRITLTSAGAPAVGAIVTVDVAGYDLFTFHGVPSASLSIPVKPIGAEASALVQGTVTSFDPLATIFLPFLTPKLDDSRRLLEVPRTYGATMCSGSAPVRCPYGTEPVRPARLGVQSFLAGDYLLSEAGFEATELIQAFCLSIPLDRITGPFPQNTSFELPFLLTDPAVEPEEIPLELPPVTFRTDQTAEIDLADLDDDPTTTGAPRVTVETNVPGIPGSVVVGLGLAFTQGPDMWTVRSAVPGAVDAAGFFGMDGAVDTDFLLRCELRDGSNRISGARPRISELGNLIVPDNLFATSPSVLTSPVPGGSSGGASYNLAFTDVIPDQALAAGLYRVELIGMAVRRWAVWGLDPPGSGAVTLHVPDIGAAGGTPLVDGPITSRISAFAWPTLDPTGFLWSDVEREHQLFSFSEMFVFDQP